MSVTGPAPKADSKRRRANTPASYGLAEPVKAGPAGKKPRLGFPAHPMVRDLWKSLDESVEPAFYSNSDWQRARIELLYLNKLLMGELDWTAPAWQRVQNGLNELLLSPADKRRAGIEMEKRPQGDAKVDQLADYQAALANLASHRHLAS